MKRHGNLDISGNLKLRGVVVDDLATQGSFYSEQFGEVAYKSDITVAEPASGGFYGIYVRESDSTPPTFKNDTIIFDSSYFYLSPNSVGKPSVSIREDNILRGHVLDFDIHRHVSGFYAIRDPDDGFITRINWKNSDFSIINRNNADVITSIVGKYYRKTFTRDDNGKIIEVNYTRI